MAKIEAVMLARGTSVLLVVLYLFASMLLSLSRKNDGWNNRNEMVSPLLPRSMMLVRSRIKPLLEVVIKQKQP